MIRVNRPDRRFGRPTATSAKPRQARLGRAARRGVTAVEGAIVLSVFLLILFVMLDLGLMVLDYNLLCEGAGRLCREAKVHGSRSAPQETMWGPDEVAGKAADGSQYAQSFEQVLATLPLADVNYTLEWPAGTNHPDDQVRATLSYQYTPMVPFVLGTQPIALEAVATLRVDH